MEENTPIVYQTVEAIAGVIYFIPLVLTLLNKKLQTTFFILFASYWTWNGLVNLMIWSNLVKSDNFIIVFESIYNIIDAPLLLLVLYATTPFKAIKQHIGKLLIVLAVSAVALLLITGSRVVVERIIAAAGVVLILGYVCWIVYYSHSKNSKFYSPLSSRQFIYYGLIFGNGCSVITYLLTYIYKGGASMDEDLFLIYHVSTIFTASIVSYGFITYKQEAPFKLRHINGYKEDSEMKYL